MQKPTHIQMARLNEALGFYISACSTSGRGETKCMAAVAMEVMKKINVKLAEPVIPDKGYRVKLTLAQVEVLKHMRSLMRLTGDADNCITRLLVLNSN